MTLGDVALAARPDGERRTGAPRGAEHHPIADDWRGNHFVAHAVAAPELGARVGVVGAHTMLAAHDDLVVFDHANGNRRSPSDVGLALGPPHLAAGARIERGNERPRELILIEDDPVLVEQWRSGSAMVGLHRPEIALPDDLSVQVECEQSASAERDVDALAVGRRRRRGVAVLEVAAPAVATGRSKRLPEPGAIAAPERAQRQTTSAVVGSGNEDAIAPDDRR